MTRVLPTDVARAPLPAPASDALLAAMVLASGSSIQGGLRFPIGVPLVVASFVIALRAAWRGDADAPCSWRRTAAIWLSVMAATALVGPSTHGALWYEIARRSYAGAALLFVGIAVGRGDRTRRRVVLAATAAAVALHLLTPMATPSPQIDVWSWTTSAARALLHGVHPYTVRPGHVSPGRYDIGYTLDVYPYMPATLLAFAPALAVFGDFRYALALAMPATIGLFRAAARRSGVDPELLDIATLAFVLHPFGFAITRSGWTEPLLVFCSAAFMYFTVTAPGGAAQAVAAFLLPALKQYVAFPFVMYLAMRPPLARFRSLAIALVAAVATVVPFVWWNAAATLHGVVFQMTTPVAPRTDAHSLVALGLRLFGTYPSRWTSVAAQLLFGMVALALLRRRESAGWLLGSAIALEATFLAGWQAFVNYYYLVFSLLLFAALLFAADRHRGDRRAERAALRASEVHA